MNKYDYEFDYNTQTITGIKPLPSDGYLEIPNMINNVIVKKNRVLRHIWIK
jgi:hypothetical protein